MKDPRYVIVPAYSSGVTFVTAKREAMMPTTWLACVIALFTCSGLNRPKATVTVSAAIESW